MARWVLRPRQYLREWSGCQRAEREIMLKVRRNVGVMSWQADLVPECWQLLVICSIM